MNDRKVKTVSFSRICEHESKLLEYAEQKERGSFSTYIKRLIDLDMNSTQRSVEWNQTATDSGQVPGDDDGEAMGGFL